MGIYHKYTCISFRPRQSSDKDYISIVSGTTGCWSSVGRISGKQEINLQSPQCLTKVGTPLHELMHAVGFLHEQNRHERDGYISIAWQNILRGDRFSFPEETIKINRCFIGHTNNFDKASKDETNGFSVPYDFRSVMHYSKTAFSTNGQPTIIPRESAMGSKMGQRDGFSRGDITKINNMYGCPEKTPGYKEPNLTGPPNGETGGNNIAENIIGGILSIFTGRDEEN
ncbi:unnamed protein product [Brassicogethes aeneus]|uniref:Metalloendopeptidase n=1 Tax=Brassicogethes aeneus TaxID=1431903 RepID=A0A9P0AU49_BRAAE|nr:unnamed protein product [Brassicogethes aeneus]